MTGGYGTYCSAINCSNCRGKNQDKSFFSFPSDPERSKRWVVNTRREDLLKRDVNYLRRNCFICSDHFESHFFANFMKNRLKPDAVPTLFNIPNTPKPTSSKRRKLNRDCTDLAEGNASSNSETTGGTSELLLSELNSPSTSNTNYAGDEATTNEPCSLVPSHQDKCIQTEAFLSSMSPRKNELRKKVHKLRVQVSRLKQKLKQKDAKTKCLRKEEIIDLSKKYMPENVAAFFLPQLHHFSQKPKGRRYNNKYRMLLLGLHFHSPRAYRYLSKHFILPHPSTLSRWLKNFNNSGPEIFQQIVEVLSLKAKGMSEEEKLCVLCMDEMAIKRKSDQVIGFEDFGNGLRSPYTANSSLVFMARGILKKWKQPIGYVLTCGACKGSRVRTLLLEVLEQLSSVGLNVLAIICDQGPNFQQVFRTLGVSVTKPFFEFSGRNYYVIYDPPHLLKSIRNNLFKYNVEFDDYVASWDDLLKLFEMDSKRKWRTAPKLTEQHLTLPPFSKMKVSRAAQVLSHTVATAIETRV